MSYRSDADPAPTQHLINELTDRVERIEQLRDEWVAGEQTGRQLRARAREVADLAQHIIAAQAVDDVALAEHAGAIRQAGGAQ